MPADQQLTTKSNTTDGTNTTHMETSITLTADEIENYIGIGKYWCQCHAWSTLDYSSQESVKSRKGLIQIACK